MTIRGELARRRKDSGFIFAILGLLLVPLTGLYYLLQTTRDIPSALVTNRVLLFVLWYINIVLILIIVFILARNLFKLALERRHRILGSKFKSKLVATYIGLSLVPVLLLFFYAAGFLQLSMERWFHPAVREVLERGAQVANDSLRMAEAVTQRDAKLVAELLTDFELADTERRPELDRRLRRDLRRLDLDVLVVYQGTDFLQGVVDPGAGFTDLPEPDRALLAQVADRGEAVRILAPIGDEGLLVVAAAVVPSSDPQSVVMAGRLLEAQLAHQSEQLIQAFQGYRQLELQRAELTASQLLLFLMITLLILLATSWVGLYLARRITIPIQALADGTRRISEGDLGYRVEVTADDELQVLVDSFNTMTSELQRNKELLESSNVELTATNRRLGNERTLFATVLQNVAAGVIAVDEGGEVFLCNQAALDMLRLSDSEVRGHTLADAWDDPERSKLYAAVTASTTRSEDGKAVRLVLGGVWKTFELKVTPMTDAEGSPLGKVIVLEELTDLIKAQQVAAWSTAARRIAHEIKNPLTPIQLAAERMLRKYEQGADLDGVLQDGVGIIVREVETLKTMVGEFSRFARMPRPQPAEIDLGAFLPEILKLYRALKDGVHVEVSVAPGASSAWADPEQLRAALINLMDNALDAVEPPGTVTVEAQRVDGWLHLIVADTGCGIPPEAKEKLFLPHFSTKGRGTGLGLAIVYRIVTDHHGTIRVENNQPQGTVFTIELPLE